MTARGFLCLVSALSLLFLSSALSLHSFFLPGALLLCLFGTGLLCVLSARLTLRTGQRFLLPEAARGDTVPLILSLTQHALLPPAHPEAQVIHPDGKAVWYVLRASCWGKSDIEIPCLFPHVGRYEAHVSRLVLSDSAGLFRFRVRLRNTFPSLLILPRETALDMPAVPGKRRIGGPADPEHDEPDRLREFLPGDGLRRVHWKLSARRGELVVRTPERKRDADLIVALAADDVSPDAFDALSEACFAFLASAATKGGRLRLLLPSSALDLPSARSSDLPLLRRALANAAGAKAASLSQILSRAALSVRLPDAVAAFVVHPEAEDADLLLRLRADGVSVRLTALSKDSTGEKSALLERLRTEGVQVQLIPVKGGDV